MWLLWCIFNLKYLRLALKLIDMCFKYRLESFKLYYHNLLQCNRLTAIIDNQFNFNRRDRGLWCFRVRHENILRLKYVLIFQYESVSLVDDPEKLSPGWDFCAFESDALNPLTYIAKWVFLVLTRISRTRDDNIIVGFF